MIRLRIATGILMVLLLASACIFIAVVYAMTFTLHSSTTETNQTYNTFLGDFDGDGDLDWVAHNIVGFSSTHDIYLNDGTAAFVHSTFGDTIGNTDAAIGDVDNDGYLDVIHTIGTGNNVYKCVNDGTGTLTCSVIITTGNTNRSIRLADIDNDGDLDILLGGSFNATNFVYLNNGHGVFTAAASTMRSMTDHTLQVADFNSDGFLDVAFVDDINGYLHVYVNSGTGAFIPVTTGVVAINKPLAAGDVDGDGDIDLVAAQGSDLIVFTNNGSASFSAGGNIPGSVGTVRSLALGDLDNNGILDLIIGGTGGAGTYIGNGMGGFAQSGTPTETLDEVRGIAIGDLDNDGDLDYVRGTQSGVPNRVYKNDQAATSANTAPAAPTSYTGATLGKMPKNAITIANDGAIGTQSWTTPLNAVASDDSYAVASVGPGGESFYLKASGFSYSIPSDATIHGIKVDVEKKAVLSCIGSDNAVRLVKGGAIGSTDRSEAGNWSGFDTYSTYGGPTDLWGTTWTASDINASNFGFAISGKCGFTGGEMHIDHIRITVYYNAADVRLSWGSGSDTQTATKMLQYQLRVGTGSSAHNIVSGATGSPDWTNRLMPNGQSRTYLLKNLRCRTELTYYWNVATIDTGFKKTSGTEQTFTLDDNCGLAFPSGGGGGPPPPPPGVGGGLSANYFRTNLPGQAVDLPGTGIITVTGFNDVDGNGSRSAREITGFKGLPLTASGRTADNVAVRRTASLGENGTASFHLPVSDSRGYWILVDTGSSVLHGYSPTSVAASGGYVLRSGDKKSVEFGLRRDDLLAYKPCLLVGSASEDELPGTDAQILQQRLQDAFGMKIVRGLDLSGKLVTRKEFFTLLSRSYCIETIRDAAKLEEKLRASAKKMKIALPLIDLRNDVKNADSLLMYSLIAAGTDIFRTTLKGEAADLSSPVTRGEAIRAVASVLPLTAEKRASTGVLPKDLDPADPLVHDFVTLQQLGILPGSFQPILGQSQGLTPEESALMLMRAALRGGRVSLLSDTPNVKGFKNAAPQPTFLAVLPALRDRACLEKDADRASAVSFADVLPGDPLFADLQDLLTRGTKNSAKQMLWLIPATRRPTEFGIRRGQTRASLEQPASILETVRDLLVLGCLPPDTALDVMSGKGKPVTQGSAETRVPRDRISGLPRDASFASRTLYRAQDHLKEFDLSLFTYAPELLRSEFRSPGSSMSVIEASRLLASGLLMMHVRNKSLSPLQAENTMEELSAAIRRDFTGKDLDWRNESSLKTVPFTKHMLFSFLATVVKGKTAVSVSVPTLPLGEIWWERIR